MILQENLLKYLCYVSHTYEMIMLLPSLAGQPAAEKSIDL